MAAAKVNSKIRKLLTDAYSKKFGRSPSRLIKALNQKYEQRLSEIRNDKGGKDSNLISDKTIRNFFSESPSETMQEASLNYLCGLLLEHTSYEEALELYSSMAEGLDQESWENYKGYITEIYGQIKVLDMREPVPLKSLYIESRLSETLRSEQQETMKTIQEVLDLYKPLERFQKDEPSLSAHEAIYKYSKLVILGNAGAGKTTALRYLLNSYVEQYMQNSILPVYVSLNDFNDDEEHKDLFEYIANSLDQFISKEKLGRMALDGKVLFLIDGLDEVRQEQLRIAQNQILKLVKKYLNSQFVIACRSAARDRTVIFNNFKTMELMNLNLEQIREFVENWFRGVEAKDIALERVDKVEEQKNIRKERWQEAVKKFMSQIENNVGAQELAQTSLLLTMLCYVFQDNYNLPRNKHALYGDAIDALFRRWDATRRIERNEVYGEKLSRDRKINMLGGISYRALKKEKGKLLWKKADIKEEVSDYIVNIPGIEIEEALDVNSERVLYEIAANNGLLLEDGRGVYRFTHRTFQEYFAARFILESNQRPEYLKEAIDTHLLDRSWREVFPIIAGRLDNGDELLKRIFVQAYQIIENDVEIQDMLRWLDNLTASCELPYIGWRALCHAVDLETKMYIKSKTISDTKSAHQIAKLVRQYNKDTSRRKKPSSRILLTLYLVIVQVLADDYAFKGQENYEPIKGYVAEFFVGDKQLNPTLDKAIQLAEELKLLTLAKKLKGLQTAIPASENDQDTWKVWAKDLNTISQEQLKVGQEIEPSEEAKLKLQDYQYACSILMDCVQGDSYASKAVREEVVNSLLLPKEKTPMRKMMEF